MLDGRMIGQSCDIIVITGTRHFNVKGMWPFENYEANYIEETDNLLLKS